jgi:endonuclease YncB( thermonuclease family)
MSVMAKGCEHTTTSFQCVDYIKNYDGDTVTFNIPRLHSLFGNKISVRINGLDTAEIRTNDSCEKKMAKVAQYFVESRLKKAKRVNLTNIKRGKYFRIVADIQYDGKDLKDEIIKSNLAYPYGGKTKRVINWCTAYERLPANFLVE